VLAACGAGAAADASGRVSERWFANRVGISGSCIPRGPCGKGYVEGDSVAIEYRWGLGQYERLSEMADDLVRLRVAIIAATGGLPSVRAAKAATSEIPIVFTMGGDPVAFGLVARLDRPGGNVTGITLISAEIVSKRIALLRDLLPGAKVLGVLMNATTPAS
jgi:putative ABC transport system substrate-binding protein